MLKRLLAVIVSAIILSLGVSLIDYIPQAQRDPNVYYMGIVEKFIFAVYIYLIFFVVVGLFSSWLIDKCRKLFEKRTVAFQYFIGVIFYSLMGLILGTVYHFVSGTIHFNLDSFIQTLGFWFIPSFFYFNVLWVIERKFSRKIRI